MRTRQSETSCLLSILRMWAGGILLIVMFGEFPFPFVHGHIITIISGNWRKSSTPGPTLLTKSCHHIDFLLWLISEPDVPGSRQHEAYHAPSSVASYGSLNVFRKERKLRAAGKATNCLSWSRFAIFLRPKYIGKRASALTSVGGQQTWRCRTSKICSMRGASRLPAMVSIVV